ncbi:TonB-dependent receptor [Roseivirga sp.]|uniref:TonB-dependent receptor n=1 Tax=Roseivirga sp. TaxID=1964215 RepID=UPI003B8CE9CC
MRRILVIVCILTYFLVNASAQEKIGQTIRGTITDADNKSGLYGATIHIIGSQPLKGAVTDFEGNFRIENVPSGRYSLQMSAMGFESRVVANVIVNIGKEVVLELSMQEAILQLEEVLVTASIEETAPEDQMVLISARSITMEQMTRMATGFNDPALITANFAGVINTGDGGNDIVVRGNSSKYNQWRLEGLPITTPNHFGDQGMLNGTTGILNSNLLASSDFYTGAFAPEFGNVIGGVYDIRLRNGNNERQEAIAGIGLLGTDLTLEGPLKKGYKGSYLFNYRYSTADILNQIGALDVEGNPKFQDAAFKLHLPTRKAGLFSVYALGGVSRLDFDDVKADDWNIPGTYDMLPDMQIEFDKKSYLFNTGIRHTYAFTDDNYLETAISATFDRIEDVVSRNDGGSRIQAYNSNLRRATYRTSADYHHKLNAKNKIQAGLIYSLFDYQNFQQRMETGDSQPFNNLNFNENIGNLRSYISLKHRFTQKLTMVAGLHNTNVFLADEHTLEPRLALKWQMNKKSRLDFGYGNHSTMEGVNHYFAQVTDGNDNVTQPNLDLGLLKAHHLVFGYNYKVNSLWDFSIEMYYQDLYDVPVANDLNNIFTTLNEDLDVTFTDLVNEGTGTNTGIEITVNRSFAKGYYFMANASVFESHYKALDGIERSTRFDNDYRFNILGGREFTGLGKKGNQTIAVNAKFFMQGGQKVLPLLRDEAGNLSVDPENNLFWDYSRAFQNSLEDLYALTLSASFKWDKKSTTHELLVNLENVTDNKGKIREYYDAAEPGGVGYTKQFGLLPNIMYKIYFR